MDSFNDVKINVRSLLTSSQKPLSIQELQKDYYDQEGENIPYKRFGFNSTIELLQSMNDVLTLPSNPSQSSLLSLVVDDKTSHLRMLVVKQKSNTKKKNKSVLSERTNKHKSYTNYHRNSSFPGNYVSNWQSQNGQNFTKIRSNIFYAKHTNEKNQQTISNVRRHSDYNQNYNSNKNGNHRTGYLTNELRSYIEKYISENQMVITINKFMEIIKNHPDFGAMNASCIQDIRHLVKDFLNVNETEVSLKKAQQFETNESILITNHDTDTLDKTFEISLNNASNVYKSLPSLSSSAIDNSIISGNNTIINDSKQFGCNDHFYEKQMLSDLYKSLKRNEHQDNIIDNNSNQRSASQDIDEVTSQSCKPVENLITQYVKNCKKQSMIRNLEDVNILNENKNSDFAKNNLKKNIEYVKRQSEIRRNKTNPNRFSNGVNSDLVNTSRLSCMNDSKSFSHSTPIQNNHNSMKKAGYLNKNPNFPNHMLLNIASILKVYCDGLSIENFKLIYCILYHADIDPSTYGFTSMMQMFKKLDHIVEIQKNVLYISPKNEISHMKNINYEKKNDALLSNNLDISLFVDQLIFPLINDFSKTEMVLVEMYNPSLFYLQLADKVMEFEHLEKQMHQFYAEENPNYNVLPHMYVAPGSIYASCYTTFLNVKQWHRVKVLREINSEIVKVIHVDYGTVDIMPKTELRFLYKEFSKLPCQAIHCCLTGYNRLEKLSPKVSEAFVEIIDNKPVMVEIDNSYNLNEQCQILHVTLYQHESNNSDKLKNINNELTIWHLKR